MKIRLDGLLPSHFLLLIHILLHKSPFYKNLLHNKLKSQNIVRFDGGWQRSSTSEHQYHP